MARRKITESERLNRLLWGEIQKGMAVLGEDEKAFCAATGISPSTYRGRRKSDPGSFRFSDLRIIARHFNWDARVLAGLFGVEMEAPTRANH